MKISVSINNTTQAKIDEVSVKKIARKVILGEAARLNGCGMAELSIVFLNPERIRQLNKRYRSHNTVTDVLSFAGDGEGCANGNLKGAFFLGELAICAIQVKEDAKDSGVAADYEMAWVVVHGILHLFGYNHETRENDAALMRAKEKFYLSKLYFNSAKLKAQSAK